VKENCIPEQTVTAVRRLQFCAGHRVYKHESKCRHLHGHNYVVFLHACSSGKNELDSLGRVIDFGVLKERFGGWIDQNWDHGFIVFDQDEEALALLKALPEQKIYALKANPTAENMAKHLLNDIAPGLLADSGVELSKVVLWETENCFVEVSRARP
jgi:6-pyruvoyltetrahydropterin/6-carboxytetrahydropterin synthase